MSFLVASLVTACAPPSYLAGGKSNHLARGTNAFPRTWSEDSGQGAASAAAMPARSASVAGGRQAEAPASTSPRASPAAVAARDRTAVSSGKLAVLDFRNYVKDLPVENVRYFTDLLREAALEKAPGLDVMTRENLIVLLRSTGRDENNCEGECEVDTGRRIGADVIVSGDIQKVGSHYKLSMRLHETHDGRLLGAAVASGANLDELDNNVRAKAGPLYDSLGAR